MKDTPRCFSRQILQCTSYFPLLHHFTKVSCNGIIIRWPWSTEEISLDTPSLLNKLWDVALFPQVESRLQVGNMVSTLAFLTWFLKK